MHLGPTEVCTTTPVGQQIGGLTNKRVSDSVRKVLGHGTACKRDYGSTGNLRVPQLQRLVQAKTNFGIVDDLRICESVRASLHIKVTSELLCQQRESHLAPG